MVASSGDAAVANGRKVSTYDSGMCQKFVRSQCWQAPSLYGSAIEAWNGSTQKHPGDRTPPMGAPCYYRGGNYGHAVTFVGSGDMRSTDCQSAYQVNDTDLAWPERAWGYVYLGWTGDINGVDLPLGGGAPTPPEEDDMPEYVHVSSNERPMSGGGWYSLKWDNVIYDTTGNAADPGEYGLALADRRYVATLLATVTIDGGERVMSRTVEVEDGEIVEANPGVEHLRTSGGTAVGDTRTGWVGKGRRLRCQLNLPEDGTVKADLTVLYW